MQEYIDQIIHLSGVWLDINLRYLLAILAEDPLRFYLMGTIVIGLPMALVSLWCYWLEERLDWHWYFWPLKIARNFVHPCSFLCLPDCEHEPRSNYRMCYEGPIEEKLGNFESPGAIPFYLIASSLLWPLRLYLSLIASAVFIGLYGIAVIINSPFLLLRGLCYLVCWPFRTKDHR